MPGFELVGIEERNAINELFDDGGILFAHGFDAMRNGRYRVREFERAFADYLGVKYAQAVSSGTAAIKVALYAAGVRAGDEVITQVFTFVATVEAILDLGAIPVFVNIDDTLNMDPNELEKAITSKTKAIMPVHMLGTAARIDEIVAIAGRYGIKVIDDNCEALGAEWGNEKLGVQSDVCTWSFDAGKVIITGEGGMVTTNDEEIYLLAREYHDHGHQYNTKLPRGRDTKRIYGFNYRMTELQAAVGIAQLKKLDYIVTKNREHFARFYNGLMEIKNIKFRTIPDLNNPLCDCLIFSLPEKELADKCVQLMSEKGIGTKNVPDAIEWHFAKYWDHIYSQLGYTSTTFDQKFRISTDLLARSVALPIMVKMPADLIETRIRDLVLILKSLD